MKKTVALFAVLLTLTTLFSCREEKKEDTEVVKITIPAVEFASFSEEEIASLSAQQGHGGYVIEKNGDVSFFTTRKSRAARLEAERAEIDGIITQILESGEIAITDIKYSEDMTKLDICIKGETFTAVEKLSPTVLLFPHMASYQYFSLYNNPDITASFIDSGSGEVIDSTTYEEYLDFFSSAARGKKAPKNNFFTKATN